MTAFDRAWNVSKVMAGNGDSCPRCGNPDVEQRKLSLGSGEDLGSHAYCNDCWPIILDEYRGKRDTIDSEKMKWVHEITPYDELEYHPGDDEESLEDPPKLFINLRDQPPENLNRKGEEELGLATRHGTHDDIAWGELAYDYGEHDGEVDLDDRLDGPDRIFGFEPTNYKIPFRSAKDKSIYFGGKRTQQAVDALGDKNIDFRMSDDPFEVAWDAIAKMPVWHSESDMGDLPKDDLERFPEYMGELGARLDSLRWPDNLEGEGRVFESKEGDARGHAKIKWDEADVPYHMITDFEMAREAKGEGLSRDRLREFIEDLRNEDEDRWGEQPTQTHVVGAERNTAGYWDKMVEEGILDSAHRRPYVRTDLEGVPLKYTHSRAKLQNAE